MISNLYSSTDFLGLLDDEEGFIIPTDHSPLEITRRARSSCDVIESDTIYCITAELPGVTKNKLFVELNTNSMLLTITADKDEVLHAEYGSETGTWINRARERSFGKVRRRFHLPAYVDMGTASTRYSDGLLKVQFKKFADDAFEAPGIIKLAIE
jgi:HSP20 family molecular chaperone IbpA